jgi:hypothetical protein
MEQSSLSLSCGTSEQNSVKKSRVSLLFLGPSLLQCEWKDSGLLDFFLSPLSLYLVAIAAAPTGIRIRRERKRKFWEKRKSERREISVFSLPSPLRVSEMSREGSA